MKRQIFKRMLAVVLGVSMVLPSMPTLRTQATQLQTEEPQKIVFEKVTAKYANNHGADLIKDGDRNTYWQSIPSSGEGDAHKVNYTHNRYIDVTLDGTYNLSNVKIFNKVDGSYNNYYIYASTDGVNYDKIISKTSNDVATAEGDMYEITETASHIRLNMAYNSNTYETNLAEIELYGVRVGERQDDNRGIQVSDWEGSEWQKEWDKFVNDEVYAEEKVLKEMKNLVGRVIGEEWQDDFRFEIRDSFQDGKDIFEVKDGADGKIVIAGNNGIALASGFNYYLKYYVNIDYNPLFGSNVQMTEIVPVGECVIKEAQYNLRYALNFCTYSYTMSFWNWDEYEEFLDWAAMNGLNLILDIVGQEEVLRQTFLEYNFTEEEIKNYISGPAYFAWFYMQNLYSVGGPLPNAWFEQRTELGRKIHDRMQTYGITPVLQGFSGQVPDSFAEKNEGAQMAPLDNWTQHTRPRLLMTYVSEGQTDYFTKVAQTFYEKQKNVFGDISDYYATDPFHEYGNVGSLDTATIYQTVQNEMINSNPEAVWVLQQWENGLGDGVKISKLDTEHVLILDLQSDLRPQHDLFERKQIPWLYCMLHNFGGRMGLDGQVPKMSSDPMKNLNEKTQMVGIGITPEALENSPVVYELFLETLWSKDPIDYEEWINNYAKRRAGGDSESLQEAWDILLNTAYADKPKYYQGAGETVMNARPADTITAASTWGNNYVFYEKNELDEALRLLADNYVAFQNSEAFKYDLADVAEQVLCNVAVEYHSRMVEAKNAKNIADFEKYSTKFLEIMDLSDKVLSSTDEFMLGTWIEASRKMIIGADDWTKDLFEFNARSLITTWGGERANTSGKLKDYSNRKWAGLTSYFYKERWEIWIRNRMADLKGEARAAADQKAENNWFLWEYQWTNRKSDDNDGEYAFATEPSNMDLAELAKQVYENYSYTALVREDGEGQEKVNVAMGKNVTLEKGTTQSGNLSNVVDDNTGTAWVGTGTTDHVFVIDLNDTWSISEFILSVPQGAKNYPYCYKLETFNTESDEWTVVEEYTERLLGSNTTITTGEKYTANKIRLTMNTSDAVDSPLTITDFAAYGISLDADQSGEEVYVNWALPETATIELDSNTQTHQGEIGYLNNGKKDGDEIWIAKGDKDTSTPAVFTMTFKNQTSVLANHIDLYFEKKEPQNIALRFQVKVTDEMGIETEITNATHTSPNNGELTERIYSLPVNKKIKKVEVSIWETKSDGAWPALAEIEVIQDVANENIASKSKVSLSEGATTENGKTLDALVDKNTSSIWVANGDVSSYPITLTLDYGKIVRANYVDVYFEKSGLPFEFKVHAIDKSGEEILVSDEYADHNDTLKQSSYQFAIGKDVRKVMVTLLGKTNAGNFTGAWPALAEIGVYGAIYAVDNNEDVLTERINEIRTTIASLNYDGYTGSYSTQEKAKLEEVLTQAEEALKVSSDAETQEALLKQVNTAFDKFYKEGKVYINRGKLLEALSRTAAMLEGLKDGDLQEERAILEPAYKSAKQVYDTYRVTQSQVDEAAQAIEPLLTDEYYAIFLDCRFANKLAEAREASGKELVYTPESLETLNVAIEETESSEGVKAKEEGYRRLRNAIRKLEKIFSVEITWKSGLSSAEGVVAGNGVYAVEDRIALSAKEVEGYKFAGWYIGKQQISEESDYEYVVKDADFNTKIDFVAKYEVLTEVSWESKPIPGGVTKGRGYYDSGEKVELLASEIEGAKFIGWYIGEEEISKELSFEYTVKETDTKVELVAKYESLTLVDVSDNEFYVGETAMIIAPADVTVEVSKEGIVKVDRDTMTVAGIGAGEVELTFKKGSQVLGTESIVVSDGDIIQMTLKDMKQLSISVTSNTEEPTGEGAGNGIDEAIIDGNSGTFWHSQWQGSNFSVNEEHPAWIEVDFGEELEIPGFVFQQRNSTNGRIQKYSYEAKNAAGQVVASKEKIALSSQEQAAGTLITVNFEDYLNIKSIRITVLQGTNSNACMAEFAPLIKKKVAAKGQITLEDAKVQLGEIITLKPICERFTVPKGLVWSSSNENIAIVNENGVVTGLNAGIVTITAKNAAGVEAVCEVEVSGYTLALSETQYAYDGTVKKPEVTVKDARGKIVPEEEYDVVYSDENSTDAGTYTVTVNFKGNSEVTLMATYTIVGRSVHTITFDSNGGNVVDQITVEDGQTAADKKPADPTKEGYLFKGWYVEDTAYNFDEPVTKDLVLTAKWTALYTVTFKNADVILHTQILEEGTKVEPYSALDMEGYKFLGWYDGNTKYDFEKNVEGNLVLLAKWLELGELTEEDQGELGDKIEEGVIDKVEEKIWVSGISDLTYNGKKQTFDIRVYDGNKILTEKKDYTVSYKNNQNAYTLERDGEEVQVEGSSEKIKVYGTKAPQVTIKMKGDYTGSRELNFQIYPVDISVSDNNGILLNNGIVADDLYMDSNAKKTEQKVDVVVTWNGKKLGKKDFTVTPVVVDITNPTTTKLTVEGCGNFTGERTVTLTVGNKKENFAMSKVKVKLLGKAKPKVDWVKEGYKFKAEDIEVKNGGTTLVNGTDYVVKGYEKNDQVGTATLILEGAKDSCYHGQKRVTFQIVGTPMSKVDVFAPMNYKKDGITYTGKPIELLALDGVKVALKTDETKELKLKEDFTAVYSKNINKGTATVVLTGLAQSGYTGTKKITYKIVAEDINKLDIRFAKGDVVEIVKGGAKPKLSISHNGIQLAEGKDYTLTYKNNKAVSKEGAKAQVIIKGKGNYKGTNDKFNFTVTTKSISSNDIKVVVKDKELAKNGKWKQTFKIYDADGKALSANKDYLKDAVYEKVLKDETGKIVGYGPLEEKITEACDICITITGAGAYTGEIKAIYKIVEANHDISKAKIKISDKEYTGGVVTISANDFVQYEIGKGDSAVELIEKDNDGNITKVHFTIDETTYQKNNKKGTAKVTIRGEGEFGGEKTVTFRITERKLEPNWWEKLMNQIFN